MKNRCNYTQEGRWSGVDLTAESIKCVGIRLRLHELLYDELKQGTVLDLPFTEQSFDKVYSCGVLHHVPEVQRAANEIHRVLKTGGELIVMLYAKASLNYLFSICILRRLLLAGAYLTGVEGRDGSKLAQHIKNTTEVGLFEYLKMKNFIHRNTDGPLNPYSKVYTLAEVKRDFPGFKITKSYKAFMHSPPLPVHGFPGGKIMGWHLWVQMRAV